MRILGIGNRIDLGDLYMALQREGHEVRVHAGDPAYAGCFGGLVQTVPDWRPALDWVGRDGIVLFEKVGRGADQEALRAQGYQVIGGSTLGDRLEYDRAFGQQALRDAGLRIAPAEDFAGPEEAAAWLRAQPRAVCAEAPQQCPRDLRGGPPGGGGRAVPALADAAGAGDAATAAGGG